VGSEDLPRGDIAGLQIDGKLLDLWWCVLEPVNLVGDAVELSVLVSFWRGDDSARLRLRFLDSTVEHLPAVDHSIAHLPLSYLDAVQHDGAGSFLVTAEAGSDRGSWTFPFEAAALEADLQVLDHRRPPYVSVFWDEGTGVWDSVTGRGALDVDELDLPDGVRELVRAWESRRRAGVVDEQEAVAVTTALREAWPDSVVSYWDNER
jgi:hypothetical protein